MKVQTINEDGVKESVISFLSFKLGEEVFAIPVMKVMEILEVTKITKIPKAPEYLRGVINLRGAVLPLVDGRIKFGMPSVDFTVNTSILVLSVQVNEEELRVGTLVDEVLEVFEMDESTIQPAPTLGANYQSEFVEGMIKRDEEFIMLLDIDQVFSVQEVVNLIEASEKEEV